MPRFNPTFAILVLVLLTGCGYKKTWVAADPMKLTAKPKGYDIPVSTDGTDREHRLLGELSVSTRIKPSWSTESSDLKAIEELRKEALKRGADAVIDLKTTQADQDGHTRLTVSGKAIIYTAPPPIAARS